MSHSAVWRGCAVAVVTTFLLTGCGTETIRPGFGPSDVLQLSVYTYVPGSPKARMHVIEDKRDVASWLTYLTDLPGSKTKETKEWAALPAAGLRFELWDGGLYEITVRADPPAFYLSEPGGPWVEVGYGLVSEHVGELVPISEAPVPGGDG